MFQARLSLTRSSDAAEELVQDYHILCRPCLQCTLTNNLPTLLSSQRIRQRHIRQIRHRLGTVRVRRQRLRHQPVQKRQHRLVRRRVVRGPIQVRALPHIRVQIRDETDEVGGHVLAGIHVEQIRPVELA